MAEDDLIHVASAARAYQESQRMGLPIFRPQIGACFSLLPTPLVIHLGFGACFPLAFWFLFFLWLESSSPYRLLYQGPVNRA